MPQVSPLLLSGAIVLYVAIQIGVGLYVARGVKTEKDFFLAGQRFGLVPIGVSLFATWFGAETIMGSSGAIAADGLSGARAEPFGYAICLFAMAFLVAGAFRARGYANLADFFQERFDHRSELATALITIIVSTIWAAAQLLALAALLETALHIPAQATLIGATLVVIVYTSLAGIAGDIVTDCIQSFVLSTGLILVLFALANHMGGFGPMLASIEPSQLKLLGEGESWLGQMDSWAIPILGSLVTQEAIARFLSTRTAKLARDATLLAAGLYLLLGIVPVLIALAGVHAFPIAGDDSDSFLPTLASQTLSPFLYVLFAGALLSAVMSTTNSNVLSVSSLMSLNVLTRVHATASERLKLRVAQLSTVGAGVFAYLIASSGQTIYELIALTSVWGQAGILVAVMIGLWSGYGGPRAAWWAILACMAVNLWTLTLDPLLRQMSGPDAVSFGDAFAKLIAGDAPTMEGYFLLSVVVSLLAYVAGAETENRDAALPASSPEAPPPEG
jgi:Na+/proline symporter